MCVNLSKTGDWVSFKAKATDILRSFVTNILPRETASADILLRVDFLLGFWPDHPY